MMTPGYAWHRRVWRSAAAVAAVRRWSGSQLHGTPADDRNGRDGRSAWMEDGRRNGRGDASSVFALSSGGGRAGVAVLRVSGPHAAAALLRMTGARALPRPRHAALRRIVHPLSGEALDRGLVLWFPGPNSFTGEDSCEFQVHGGPAVVSAILRALGEIEGLRPAEAGDFTKRAFQNGRLELTEVEGLGDLIHAETEAQRRQALRQMEGDLGRLYSAWSDRLKQCLAHVEAYIDFSEDDNIEDGVLQRVEAEVRRLSAEVSAHLRDGRQGERLRSGLQVVIAGPTNAGKSSLLNALCQRPAAIVSPIAGTTRDVVETALDLAGYPIVLSDTAGLRPSLDPVEQEGVRRARQRLRQADIAVVVLDATEVARGSCDLEATLLARAQSILDDGDFATPATPATPVTPALIPLPPEDGGQASERRECIVVLNKVDLLQRDAAEARMGERAMPGVCAVSCQTEEGLDEFLRLLKEKVEKMCGDPLTGHASLTQARHRTLLGGCAAALSDFLATSGPAMDVVLGAEHLRSAMRQLGRITGRVGAEDILDVIFRDFCIGK
ncbi:unnamed protein product [Lampetra fluviatilis]